MFINVLSKEKNISLSSYFSKIKMKILKSKKYRSLASSFKEKNQSIIWLICHGLWLEFYTSALLSWCDTQNQIATVIIDVHWCPKELISHTVHSYTLSSLWAYYREKLLL